MLTVPGVSRDIRVPQARRSSAVAIVLTRGESINLQQSVTGRKKSRGRKISATAKTKLKIVRVRKTQLLS